MFKMRELRGAGLVTVEHIPTEINPADLFTKILSRQVFEKHRRTVDGAQLDRADWHGGLVGLGGLRAGGVACQTSAFRRLRQDTCTRPNVTSAFGTVSLGLLRNRNTKHKRQKGPAQVPGLSPCVAASAYRGYSRPQCSL